MVTTRQIPQIHGVLKTGERPDCAVHRQSCGSACDHAEATVVGLAVPQVAVSSSERIVAQIVDLPAPQVVHSAPKKCKKNRKKPVVEPQQDAEVSQRSRDLADLAHDPQWRALMSKHLWRYLAGSQTRRSRIRPLSAERFA